MYDAYQLLIGFGIAFFIQQFVWTPKARMVRMSLSLLAMAVWALLALRAWAGAPLMIPIDPRMGSIAADTLLALDAAAFLGIAVYKFVTDFRSASRLRAERPEA